MGMADARLDTQAHGQNEAERAFRAADAREAAERAFQKSVDAAMEKIARATSPEALLDALEGVDVRALDPVEANALRFRLNQLVPIETNGRPRTDTELKIFRRIIGNNDVNARILEGAVAEMVARSDRELTAAVREAAAKTAAPEVKPPEGTPEVPGVVDRFLRNARKTFGL